MCGRVFEFFQETYKLGCVPHMSLQVTNIVRSAAIWVDREYVYRPLPATNGHPSRIIVPCDALDDCVGSSSLQVINVNWGNLSGMQTGVD